MLAEEAARLHRLPEHPYTTAFGQARRVGIETPMVQLDWCLYSVPYRLAGESVWARVHGSEIVLTHLAKSGPVEVARHQLTTPGNPRVDPSHFPPAPETPLERAAVAANDAEAEFLAIGAGARLWLAEAGAVGARRVRAKMAEAVTLAKLSSPETVDWALGHAAVHNRFAEGDLAAIVAHHGTAAPGQVVERGESHSLQPGTGAWKEFGR
jgi:hypothetical protein